MDVVNPCQGDSPFPGLPSKIQLKELVRTKIFLNISLSLDKNLENYTFSCKKKIWNDMLKILNKDL